MSALIVGRMSGWSDHVVESTPLAVDARADHAEPRLPISSCTSPWFQAKPGLTQIVAPHVGVEVWKKKSGSPNIVNVGVRSGSVLTMWRVFSSTGRRGRSAIGPWRRPDYGSSAVALPTSRSSGARGVVRAGRAAPLT